MPHRLSIRLMLLAGALLVAPAPALAQDAPQKKPLKEPVKKPDPAAEAPAEPEGPKKKPIKKPPAEAADPASPATAADDELGPPPGMEEIIVTATKNEENLQRVPASVATINEETIGVITSAGVDIRFLAARVPSLNAESSFGRTFPRFYIRGLGNTDFDLNASQPVSLVYDGIVLENPTMKAFPAFDLDRIEVLRGPQGTLFGRNTPAGTVKLESKKPTDELDGYASIAYGRFNLVDFEGAVGGPIVDGLLSGRASVLYQRQDDYVDNTQVPGDADLEGFQDIAFRGQLLLEAGDFTGLLNVHGRELDGTARLFRANIIKPGGGLVDDFDRFEVSQDGQNEQTLSSMGMVLNLTYDLGDFEIVSLTGYEQVEAYSRGDIDGGFGAAFIEGAPMGPGVIPFPSESADGVPKLNQLTQELRLSSSGLPVDFTVGGFFFNESLEIDSFSFDTLADGAQNGYAKQTQDTTAFAAFGSAKAEVAEVIEVRAGVRYSNDEKEFTAERVTSPIGGDPLAPVTVNPSDSFVSWDASLTWLATDSVNVYTRAAQGFRSPSVQGRVLFGDVVSIGETESILSFEAGVKSQLLNGLARLNVAGFYYILSDQQLTAVGGAGNFNTLINAEETIGSGFEADISTAPIDHLFLTAGVSFNSTEIKDADLTVVGGGAQGITFEDEIVSGEGGTVVNLNGNPLPQAPVWIANLTARYGIPVAETNEIFLFVDAAYRSEVNFFLYESAEFRDDGRLELGARLGYIHAMDEDTEFEVAAYGRNLLDDTSLNGGIDFNNLTGFVNEPLTFGLELTARF